MTHPWLLLIACPALALGAGLILGDLVGLFRKPLPPEQQDHVGERNSIAGFGWGGFAVGLGLWLILL
jgi:hypothetical protein